MAQRRPDEITLLVFDFDKTLTNGFADPDAPIEGRVSGGSHPADALRTTLSTWGMQRIILTARPPSKSTVESVLLQLTGAMQLGDCFVSAPSSKHIYEQLAPFAFGSNRATLAHAADVYAS